MKPISQISNTSGFTLIELLIALLISGLLTGATYSFYSKVSHQSEVQYDVSEMQHVCRVCLGDIRKSIRSAGYMLSGHQPFAISGDTLAIYASKTQPVDTTLYYLTEYSANDYSKVPGIDASTKIYYMMKKVNDEPAVVLADFLSRISYDVVSPSTIQVTLTSLVPRSDEDFQGNHGFRDFTLAEKVNMRNVN